MGRRKTGRASARPIARVFLCLSAGGSRESASQCELIMTNFFESPFKGIPLTEQVRHPNIVTGRYSYYSGYYHGHSFDDCARFLLPHEGADRLIVGSF
jgi:hypothetical protein